MARPGPASLIAGVRGAITAFRARLAARPDSEHEQALVRMAISCLLVLYLLPYTSGAAYDLILYVGSAHFALSALVFLRLLNSPERSAVRRMVAITADFATVTCYMVFLGERAAPLFLLYVWMTLANGFRFGKPYLLASLALGALGFSTALWQSEFWRSHVQLGYSLLGAFIVLNLYVQSLVTKLYDALAHAEAANQAKRRFISVISHEMRTPLNAIIGMADLLRDTTLTREQADMLQTLRSSSRLMLGLVEDVLDFSKIEAGKVVLDKADFDLHALVNSTCRIVAAQAAAKALDFVVSIMPDVPPAIRGDPHYLRQVLINLAGNAVKFTERGSVTVHVSTQLETEKTVRIKFSVRDTGIGISPAAQSRIFESFTQADQSTTRRFGGTGLGTTIAKQLVGLMGGKLGLESAVGLGSTFWFEIELEKQSERAGAATGELAGARVLLVGFPEGDREPVERALTGWGATAVAVETIEECAVRLVADISLARPYHSAIFFCEREDLGLAQKFRSAAPNPPPPAVLAMPRYAGVRRFDALSAGFSAVLELPFEKRELFNVLHSVAADEEVGESVVRLQDYTRRAPVQALSIVVADDNPTNREVIGKILERGGHRVTLVNDGEQALDAIERERPDVVLLDRNMPGMGGMDALQAIRLLDRGRSRLPAAMLSADVTSDVKREALEAGFDAFLAKPVEAMRLLDEVQALGASKSEQRSDLRVVAPSTSRTATAVTSALVNSETLARLEDLGSSSAFVEKLIGVFVADNTALLARIDQAIAGRSYSDFRSHLHAMKGSSASMGTDRLTALCGTLGKLADSELRLKGPALLRSLSEELDAARSELERYVRERRQSTG